MRKAVEKAAAAKPAQGNGGAEGRRRLRAYLDTARIDELGLKPFEADLAQFQRG